jgi:sirohydrochlorin ferrochelatase
MKTGIVLLGHGSRAAVDEANQVLLALAEMVGAKAGADLLEAAFLNPRTKRQNLAEAVGGLISRGAQKIIVVPVFLANGLHVQQDIPAEIEELREKYRVEITLARCLGADPRIADIILDRIGEVTGFGFFDRAAGH